MRHGAIIPIDHYRVGIATTQARPYYAFTRWLRGMGVVFDVLDPREMPGYGGRIMLTTRAEARAGTPRGCAVLFHDELERGSTVALSLLLRRLGAFGDDLVAGIDPGKLLGLAVVYAGREVEASLFTAVPALVSHISYLLREIRPSACTIRIGNGDMESACAILRCLESTEMPPFRLHMVDEAGTSPRCKNCNRRGVRDMLAARSIAGMGFGRGPPAAAAV